MKEGLLDLRDREKRKSRVNRFYWDLNPLALVDERVIDVDPSVFTTSTSMMFRLTMVVHTYK